MKKSTGIIAGLLVVLLCGGFGYYSLVFTKSPIYSVKIIGESFVKRDILAFEEYVDVESIIDKGIDAVVSYQLKKMQKEQADQELPNQFAAGLVQLIKPMITQRLTSELKFRMNEYFNDSKTSGKNEGVQRGNSNDGEQKVAKRTPVLKSIKEISRGETTAIVSVVFVDPDGTERDLRCRMQRLTNKEWKVVEIANLANLIAETDLKL